MKHAILAILLLGSLIGGATVFGLGRGSGSSKASAETQSRLDLAERLVATEPDRSLKVIDELVAAGFKPNEAARLIRLRALESAGNHSAANQEAVQFLTDFPDSENRTDVELVRITTALSSGSGSSAAIRQDAEKFVAEHGTRPEALRIQVALAQQEITAGDISGAQRRLRPLIETAQLDDPAVFAVADMLGRANLERLLSGTDATDQIHEVRSGESINGIARRNGLTDELLLRANNITDPRRLRIGQKLRIPAVDFTLHVDLASNTMVLKNQSEFFKIYNVRTGREEGATPVGTFRVLNKKKGPTWRPGNGDVYGPDDPNNELGTRWMAFEGDILGIHGTLHPETIGEYASNGCVGMLTEDVEELFDLITTGTTLEIKGERDLNRHRVIPAAPLEPPRQLAQN